MSTRRGLPGQPVQVVLVHEGYGWAVQGGDLHVIEGRGPVYQMISYVPAHAPECQDEIPAQPSYLLNAMLAIVGFTGRDDDLAALTAWLAGTGLAVRWLHGAGGIGKTRLATQLADQAVTGRWKVLTVSNLAGAVPPKPGTQDLRPLDAAGLLLIVDYAERWPLLHLTWLLGNNILNQPRVPVRVLLVARSLSGWPELRAALTASRLNPDAATTHPLPPLPEQGDARQGMFAAARAAFARIYRLTDPTVIGSPADLDSNPAYGLTLTVHMAALSSIDAHHHNRRPPDDPVGHTRYLLDRERRHWQILYENGTVPADTTCPDLAGGRQAFCSTPQEMTRAVFLATLTGPIPHQQARVLYHTAGIRDADQIITDHTHCYPSANPRTVSEPLYPDRLAEDFVALTIPGHRHDYPSEAWAASIPETLFRPAEQGKYPPYAPRLVTVLAAAAERWPHLIDTLDTLDAHLPYDRHIDLDIAAAELTTRRAEYYLRTADPAEQGHLYTSLSHRLANAGRHDAAAAACQQAVSVYHALAAADPDTFEPDLARMLTNLGIELSELGRTEDALAAVAEAVNIFRRQAAANPAAYVPDLAQALTSLAAKLWALRRTEHALAALTEAFNLYRASDGTHPARAVGDLQLLATISINLGVVFSDLGRTEDALTATSQAVEIYRALSEADPAAFESGLAEALTNLSADLGRTEDALAAITEAVEIRRRLATANPTAHEPGLARALTSLGHKFSDLGQLEDASSAMHQAVEVYRRLAATTPGTYEPSLAKALTNLGVELSRLNRLDRALAATTEAADMYRQLATANPAAFEGDLATVVNNCGMMLGLLERWEEALAATVEAVEICRQQANANPAAFEPKLARHLVHLARLRVTGDIELPQALQAAREAVTIYELLAQRLSQKFAADLYDANGTLADVLDVLGRIEDARQIRDRHAKAPG
jgi:tetratricopeptide (TPR) repeat protein